MNKSLLVALLYLFFQPFLTLAYPSTVSKDPCKTYEKIGIQDITSLNAVERFKKAIRSLGTTRKHVRNDFKSELKTIYQGFTCGCNCTQLRVLNRNFVSQGTICSQNISFGDISKIGEVINKESGEKSIFLMVELALPDDLNQAPDEGLYAFSKNMFILKGYEYTYHIRNYFTGESHIERSKRFDLTQWHPITPFVAGFDESNDYEPIVSDEKVTFQSKSEKNFIFGRYEEGECRGARHPKRVKQKN